MFARFRQSVGGGDFIPDPRTPFRLAPKLAPAYNPGRFAVPRAWRQAQAMNSEPSRAPRAIVPCLLVALVDRVCGRPGWTLGVSLLLAGLSVYAASCYLEYHTQRTDLISPQK